MLWMKKRNGEPIPVEDDPATISQRLVEGYRACDAPTQPAADTDDQDEEPQED